MDLYRDDECDCLHMSRSFAADLALMHWGKRGRPVQVFHAAVAKVGDSSPRAEFEEGELLRMVGLHSDEERQLRNNRRTLARAIKRGCEIGLLGEGSTTREIFLAPGLVA